MKIDTNTMRTYCKLTHINQKEDFNNFFESMKHLSNGLKLASYIDVLFNDYTIIEGFTIGSEFKSAIIKGTLLSDDNDYIDDINIELQSDKTIKVLLP